MKVTLRKAPPSKRLMTNRFAWIALWIAASCAALPGQVRRDYAIVLAGQPVARAAAPESAVLLRREQQGIREVLAGRKIRVRGATHRLVNAIFTQMTEQEAEALRQTPGVRRVERLAPVRMHLDRAADLVRAPQAWNALGGQGSAGTGVKIAILDTGIDHTHAGFRDDALQVPAGFPKGEVAYTTRKIIAARSYVAQLPFADVDPVDSLPDDYSPRDRQGHGTAVAMIAAGVAHQSPVGVISGIAPKAYLGNYKIAGSPGVNDVPKHHVIVQALEDALADGMDIALLPFGSPATYAACEQDGPETCDLLTEVVENAVASGLTVVTSAGNSGATGFDLPTLSTIESPGITPSAITVGSSTSSRRFFGTITGAGRQMRAVFGDGARLSGPFTAPMQTVSGQACAALPAGSLAGAVALIQRGGCGFNIKTLNAQSAGAVAVLIYQSGGDEIFQPTGLRSTAVPVAMIGNSDGVALRNLTQRPDLTLDPAWAQAGGTADAVAEVSSRGPAITDITFRQAPVKPELVAPGLDVYTAAQTLDPSGPLYHPSGYFAAQGSSFAAAVTAGAAALVKQRQPNFTPGRIKSALVNTASTGVTDAQGAAGVVSVGAGKLDVAAAVAVGVTVEPATLGFGSLGTASLPVSRTLRITNASTARNTFTIRASDPSPSSSATVSVTAQSIDLDPGQSSTITVRLAGTRPAAGSYTGVVTITGANTTLRAPYLFIVTDNVARDVIPILGSEFLGAPGQQDVLIGFRLVDRFGLPVRGQPVTFRAVAGGGSIYQGDAETDVVGAAAARVDLGQQLGEHQFQALVAGETIDFFGRVRPRPAINTGGVTNAASLLAGQGFAPGSYITIKGRGLAESTVVASTSELPVSLAGVSVGFDAPGLSLPGRLHFVSDGQVNVQIPWEFEGRQTVQMKVSIGSGPLDQTALVTLPLVSVSPGIFEFDDAGSGRRLAAVLDENYAVVTGANPARRGRAIQLYCNGLGAVSNRPASGLPAGQPLSETGVPPSVTIGGVPARVLFSGMTPGAVGLYQVNVEVPPNAPTGLQPIILTINGVSAKSADLAVN